MPSFRELPAGTGYRVRQSYLVLEGAVLPYSTLASSDAP
jgi:hypothetical protein